ncbi:MAG: RNA repair domain-containing protein [Nanoarchaeota archaeon]
MPFARLKHYLLNLYEITGLILIWAGIWDGFGNIGILNNNLFSIFLAIVMLALIGIIFKKAQPLPLAVEHKKVHDVINKINRHPEKYTFSLRYRDQIRQKPVHLSAKNLHKIEKDFIIFTEQGRELFIPVHRVGAVFHKGKLHWQPEKEVESEEE